MKKFMGKKLLALALALMLVLALAVPAFAEGEELSYSEKYPVDPEKPYSGVFVGEYEVTFTLGEDTYPATYYLAQDLEPWTPATIVLTPDNTTAAEFASGETGMAWKAYADEHKFALVFFAPADGGSWNLAMSEDGRDEGAAIHALFATMRSKKTFNAAAFWNDKTTTNIVGYGEGGAAALLFGAEYATDWASLAAVDATAIPAGAFEAIGDKLVYPFPGDSNMGLEEMNIKAKTVDMPVWFVNSAANNEEALNYFIAANEATEVEPGLYQAANSDACIKVTEGEVAPAELYGSFLGTVQRFMAMQEGGRVAKVVDYGTIGFVFNEEPVNGEIRRWINYVPSTYTGEEAVPVVVVMHGYTGNNKGIIEETRWFEIAEENNIIVVFPQAYVRPTEYMGNIPSAVWIAGAFKPLFPAEQYGLDIDFINYVLDDVEADYNVDASRIYATGHSNGSMLAFNLGEQCTSRFAAIAPIGYIVAPTGGFASDALLPMWMLAGEFDSNASPILEGGKTNVNTLMGWNEHNGVDETTAEESTTIGDRFENVTFYNKDGVPMTRFTRVLGTPHAYLMEEAVTIWNDFFAKFSRGEDGTLYYEGNAVNANEYAAADGWFIPAE